MNAALHVVCPDCSTTNRVARERLDAEPRCGSCRQPLFSGHPIELDKSNFDRHVGANDVFHEIAWVTVAASVGRRS